MTRLFQQDQIESRAGPPRAGRRPCGGRLRPVERQGRRASGDIGTRRDQYDHRPHRRADGFDSAGLHHRPGERRRISSAPTHSRNATRSASRAIAPSIIIWCTRSRICRAFCTRRSTSRRMAGRVPSSSTFRRTCNSPSAPMSARPGARAQNLQAEAARRTPTRSSRRDHAAFGAAARFSTPAAASSIPAPRLRGRWRELVELTGFPITSTLMGLGAYPASGEEMARHARHARHLRGQ